MLPACGGAPSAPAPAQPPSSAAVLDEIVSLMQERSVHRFEIDWASFRSKVTAAAGPAKTTADIVPAISLALGLLNDHHSSASLGNGTSISNPSFPPCFLAAPDRVVGVPPDIGYVKVDATNNSPDASYALALQNAIKNSDSNAVRGWIVDLRGNGGGGSYPMIAGIGPILGDGIAGYFVAPGVDAYPWGYNSRGSWAFNPTNTFVAVSAPYTLIRPNPRVAVLTSRWVASAGEAVAVAFVGRPNTRTFGTMTCGVPTGNSTIQLSDGGKLILTTAFDADRNLRAYNEPLLPDEQIEDPSLLLQRAIEWLRAGSQP